MNKFLLKIEKEIKFTITQVYFTKKIDFLRYEPVVHFAMSSLSLKVNAFHRHSHFSKFRIKSQKSCSKTNL